VRAARARRRLGHRDLLALIPSLPPGPVVALRAIGLGDLLTGVPALRALRRAADGPVTLLTSPPLLDLARLAAVADTVLAQHGLEPPVAAPRRPALAVNLHGRGPQSTALLARLEPLQLWAFDVVGGPSWAAHPEPERARWCRLLAAYGVPADPTDLAVTAPPAPVPVPDGAVVVHPGAAYPARRWPPQRWAEVVRALRRDGHPVLLTGGPGERNLVDVIAEGAGVPGSHRLTALDLIGLVGVVGAGRLLLAPDTGVAHVATAVGTPSVLLFGPSEPAVWGPPPGPPHRVLWAGRSGDPHAATTDAGLLEISPAEVIGAARGQLG